MNIKKKVLIMFFTLIISTFYIAVQAENNIENSSLETKEIRVALVSQTLLINSGQENFLKILEDYSWIVGNTKYFFNVHQVTDKNIYKGDITTKNYDILIMPGGGGGGHSIWTKSMLNRPLVKRWRKELVDFIKNGGGYLGVCGGTYFLLGLERSPNSPSEWCIDRSSLGISCVELSFSSWATPIFSQFIGLESDSVGISAYMFYSGWDYEFYQIYPSGLCIDVPINRNNSLFDDYLEDTVRIRWVSGPAYSISKNPGRQVTVLARFPEEEISDNESMKIHVWRYTGGLRGLIKGTIRHIRERGFFLKNISNCLFMASDWERTDKIIKTNFSNKPFMTAEIYPNEKKARILLCSGHPEMQVWWGGNMMEVEDNRKNTLYDGLCGWENAIPPDETPGDELTHNWWIIRRGVAWASQKVHENALPPVYGNSQVSDIHPYKQQSTFHIKGNAKNANGRVSLELYYRYSADNETWNNWLLYDTDSEISDGWSWNFNSSSANGPGYYHFYSIRKVQYADYLEIETEPPGPDAFTRVVS